MTVVLWDIVLAIFDLSAVMLSTLSCCASLIDTVNVFHDWKNV